MPDQLRSVTMSRLAGMDKLQKIAFAGLVAIAFDKKSSKSNDNHTTKIAI
jgi:hypothetical protein